MSYIIMGLDECGQEFRPEGFGNFATHEEAEANWLAAREQYPEARAIWVELLQDKSYYYEQWEQRFRDGEEDLY